VIILLLVIAAFISLACSAFCSGTETAFLSVGRERVLHLAREGGRKAQKVQRAISDMGRTTITLLIGNNIANVAYSSATAALSVELFGHNDTLKAVWGFLAAFTVLYVAEFLPKLLCAARPLRRSLRLSGPYEVMAALLRPFTAIAMALTNLFIAGGAEKYRLTMSDLMRILEDRKDGVCLSDFESALITKIIVLRAKGKPITPEALMSALEEKE
jgi:Mg2+/Co2+ transporter CorB